MTAVADVENTHFRRPADVSRVGWTDRFVALLLLIPVLLGLGIIWLCVISLQGRPFFYASERMSRPGQSFRLVKIRTMEPARSGDVGQGAPGGDCLGRVTPAGRILRKYRLDELPQIINILKGDMRFIGPRPPLRRHVEAFPTLYARVLEIVPGVTGLATVMVHCREERLLSACRTAAETEHVYRTRCIPIKARIDLIYQKRRSLALDALILLRTFSGLVGQRRANCNPNAAQLPAETNRATERRAA